MRLLRSALLSSVLVLGVLLAGCAATSAPTDQAPPWVQLIDKVLATKKDAAGQVTSTGAPVDPLGGAIPMVTVGLGAAALLWRAIRGISDSVPAATHNQLIQASADKDKAHAETVQNMTDALQSSQPVSVAATMPIKSGG
jgi:hypothetical protein